MSKKMTLAMVAVAAWIGPMAQAQARPTGKHAMGPDGSVYYADRASGEVVRVLPDGTSVVVANRLNSPTGLEMVNGNLLVGDEVGVHRIFVDRGTISLLRTLSTEFEPLVRFEQESWIYREAQGRIKVSFKHNLQDVKPTFDIQVSRDGGRSWQLAASNLERSNFTWVRPDSDDASVQALNSVRFRVTAYVDGVVKCSDVSDEFETPTPKSGGQ